MKLIFFQGASWFNWPRETNRAFSYNYSVKGQLLGFCCSSSCSKVFSFLFSLSLTSIWGSSSFLCCLQWLIFLSRENILSPHEDLSLLKLMETQSIYIKVYFRDLRQLLKPTHISTQMFLNGYRLSGMAGTQHQTPPFLPLNLMRFIGYNSI